MHARGMPWTLPLGLLAGVFMSAWAFQPDEAGSLIAPAEILRYSAGGPHPTEVVGRPEQAGRWRARAPAPPAPPAGRTWPQFAEVPGARIAFAASFGAPPARCPGTFRKLRPRAAGWRRCGAGALAPPASRLFWAATTLSRWGPPAEYRSISAGAIRLPASSAGRPCRHETPPASSPAATSTACPWRAFWEWAPPELAGLLGYGPKVAARNAVIVGLRDVDQLEKPHVRESGVNAFTMRDIDERGLRWVMEEAIRLASDGTAGFHLFASTWISWTLNMLPASARRARRRHLSRGALAMEMICDSGKMVSLEVVEVKPRDR